jgi:hypothetical protein
MIPASRQPISEKLPEKPEKWYMVDNPKKKIYLKIKTPHEQIKSLQSAVLLLIDDPMEKTDRRRNSKELAGGRTSLEMGHLGTIKRIVRPLFRHYLSCALIP